ncbi:MAG: hypothetical protein ACJAYE_002729 [Candidatus Azotimanducaceae bacterium]|jgi:hypothetical protein
METLSNKNSLAIGFYHWIYLVLAIGALLGPINLMVMVLLIGLFVFLNQLLDRKKGSPLFEKLVNDRLYTVFLLVLAGLSIGKVMTG